MDWRKGARALVASVALVSLVALWPVDASAHGRRGARRAPAARAHVGGGFYGFGPYFGYPYLGLDYGYGWGFGPFWGPYEVRPEGGIDPNVAMMVGWGAVDLNVKPDRAEVWVDGKYFAEARDLDGSPSYLWLPEGEHQLKVRKGGFATFETPIDIQRGMVKKLKVRMEKGDTAPARKDVAEAH